MKIFIKKPHEKLREIEVANELEALQELVGGYIETVQIATNLAMIVNEEGKLMNLPDNFRFGNDMIKGTALFVGVAGDEFDDVPVYLETLGTLFPQLMEE